MSTNIAKYEFEILNEFQKELHFVPDQSEITSVFYKEYRKTMWYSQASARLRCVSNDNELIYTVNNTFHELLYTYMRQTYPALRVKKDWRDAGMVEICWSHNMGTNNVVNGRLKFDDDVPQTIDSVWFDIVSQFYMKPGFRDHYNICVGNVPFLESWATSLPEYTTNIIQPFYHSTDPCRAIPLFYFSSLATISYHYTIRNHISELLRMRVKLKKDVKVTDEFGKTTIRKEEYWKEVPVNFKYLEGAGSTGMLKLPEVWGRYAYLTEDEVDWYKTCDTEEVVVGEKKETRIKDKIIYIEDVIACQSSNPQTLGSRVGVELDCKTPAKAIFWVTENLTARANRNFSNYTTNPESVYKGWNPNSKVSLSYGGSPRLDDMDIDHFDKIECWKHFPSPPSEPGYNAYSFSYDSTSLDADVGIVMDGIKARLTTTLSNTDPFMKPIKVTEDESEKKNKVVLDELGDESNTDRGGDKYITHCRLLVTRKMKISKLGEDQFKIEV